MPPYDIAVDDTRRTLRVTLNGFWDVPTTTRYLADLTAGGMKVSRGGEPSWWLIDTSGFAVQSQAANELMKEKLPSVFPPGATVAVVVAAQLQLMQVKRVAPDQNHQGFATAQEAERWLVDRGMPA